jgi:hypothetical protein
MANGRQAAGPPGPGLPGPAPGRADGRLGTRAVAQRAPWPGAAGAAGRAL